MRQKEKNKEGKLDYIFIRLSLPPLSKLIGEVNYIYKNFECTKDLAVTLNISNNLNNIYFFFKVCDTQEK